MVVACDNFLTAGACDDPHCTRSHGVYVCEACHLLCPDLNSYNIHLSGKRHASVTSLRLPIACGLCDGREFNGPKQYEQHATGKDHIQRLSVLKGQPPRPKRVPPEGSLFCESCVRVIKEYQWGNHINGRRHIRQLSAYDSFLGYRAATGLDGSGPDKIRVSHDATGVDFGKVDVANVRGGALQVQLKIELLLPLRIRLVNAFMSNTVGKVVKYKGQNPFAVSPAPSLFLSQGAPSFITVKFTPEQAGNGQHSDRLEMTFEDVSSRNRFSVIRQCRAVVGDLEALDALQPTSEFAYKPRRTERPSEVVPGIKAGTSRRTNWVIAIPQYPVPKGLEKWTVTKNVDEVRRRCLPGPLSLEVYKEFWAKLLWFEEMQMHEDMRRFDMDDALLEPQGKFYLLDVPGLAEKRPSVLQNDSIRVSVPGSNKSFQGYVHDVQETRVWLRFNGSFSSLRGQRWNVEFDLRRTVLRRMHNAIHAPVDRVLSPTVDNFRGTTCSSATGLRLFNRILSGNDEQLGAIGAIIAAQPGSAPFIVYGPPGTGKTVTIVEAIRQLLDRDHDVKILACAPSNSAADLITERLFVVGPRQLFRLMAPSRSPATVSARMKDYTTDVESNMFMTPNVVDLMKYRVVVTTCASASVLSGLGIPLNHFTHCFIDEAGQACEPELYISIAAGVGGDTNLILAGDPKQLGPVIRSRIAAPLGMDLSYLERLMSLDLYSRPEWSGISHVKLLNNYRNHPAILEFPNQEFYGNELISCADGLLTQSLRPAPCIAAHPDYPVIFHAIKGKDMREGTSPSFFNPDEVALVVQVVKDLFEDRRLRLKPEDVGIIAPYNAQGRKIQQLLAKDERLKGIMVGATERFQGQERRVIIISTVRSTDEYLKHDLEHSLGFVASPKRLNVALTRAQALLIIVGDPHVLSVDGHWCRLLSSIYRSGGWHGKIKPDWDPDDPPAGGVLEGRSAAFLVELKELVHRTDTIDIFDERLASLQEDVPWVREE